MKKKLLLFSPEILVRSKSWQAPCSESSEKHYTNQWDIFLPVKIVVINIPPRGLNKLKLHAPDDIKTLNLLCKRGAFMRLCKNFIKRKNSPKATLTDYTLETTQLRMSFHFTIAHLLILI